MNLLHPLLFAEAARPEGGRVTYDWSRLQDFSERWEYLGLALIAVAVASFVVYMYRRDGSELNPFIAFLLTALRLTAFAGVVLYFLGLEKRTEKEVVRNSRVAILVDSSLSMSLRDSESTTSPGVSTRLEQVVETLAGGKLVEKLRARHDVALSRFDGEVVRVAALPKLIPAENSTTAPSKSPLTAETKPEADWVAALAARGVETRLGQALRSVLAEERSNPLTAVVVFTDGEQNAGEQPSAAAAAAVEAGVPIFTVGVGSAKRPVSVRVGEIAAPARVFPNDGFAITGFIQAQELAGRTVSVELTSRNAAASNTQAATVEGTQSVELGKNGEAVAVRFELAAKELGRRVFEIRVKAPPEDTELADNADSVDIEVVDRKTRVLLLAGGPTRDYIYLRNLLRRDRDMIVDVLLQNALPGISQDANQVLTAFPSSPEKLYEYDAIIAFDPNWTLLEDKSIDILERWVAEKAGGLILVAGPVNMNLWLSDQQNSERLAKIRALFPIEFTKRWALDDSAYGSEQPWPIAFTREGMDAEFLWLGDTGPRSLRNWAEFPGVYGYFAVKGEKPGATVYARFSDPQTSGPGGQPVYFASQFYGAGRVFYLGSGEMWRLRALTEGFFEQLYTKLVRYVSQGRLLVGSSRGMLLVERDRYLVGGTVEVRAQLSTPQFQPLTLPSVGLDVVRPDGQTDIQTLKADDKRPGMYTSRFNVTEEGAYRLSLPVPDSAEQLTRRIQVRVPDLERENPQRNDPLLDELAKSTGGIYYIGPRATLGENGAPPLELQLKDRTETTFLADAPDADFERQWMQILLGIICGALSLKWLLRRLYRLA